MPTALDVGQDAKKIGLPHSPNPMLGGRCADPEEKRGPANDAKAGDRYSSKALDLDPPNREVEVL